MEQVLSIFGILKNGMMVGLGFKQRPNVGPAIFTGCIATADTLSFSFGVELGKIRYQMFFSGCLKLCT